jgi:predicted ferric reductase
MSQERLRWDRIIIISLIFASTLPFLLLYIKLKEFDLATDPEGFWSKAAMLTANISGFIGAMLLFWEFVIGIRQVAALGTPDLNWVNRVHQFIGKYALLLVFVHPLLEIYVYFENWLWLFVPNLESNFQTHLTFGRVAFVCFILIYGTSALLRSKIKYRPWKLIHYLNYVIMIGVFLHALDIGTFLKEYIVLKALWFTMLALWFVMVFLRVVWWTGIVNPRYKIIHKTVLDGEVLVIRLIPLGNKIIPKPGQYFNIQLTEFGESHPFSVMDFDEMTGELVFGIKMLGKFSKKTGRLGVGDELILEGSYGVFTIEGQNDKPKVVISGGIGCTPFVGLIKRYGDQNTIMLNANRTLDEALNRKEFVKKLGPNYRDFLSKDKRTGLNITNSRIEAEYIYEAIEGKLNAGNYNYFLCGSPLFMKSIVDSLELIGVKYSQIFIEEFNM